jgi:hypothetical protein
VSNCASPARGRRKPASRTGTQPHYMAWRAVNRVDPAMSLSGVQVQRSGHGSASSISAASVPLSGQPRTRAPAPPAAVIRAALTVIERDAWSDGAAQPRTAQARRICPRRARLSDRPLHCTDESVLRSACVMSTATRSGWGKPTGLEDPATARVGSKPCRPGRTGPRTARVNKVRGHRNAQCSHLK